MSIRGLTFAFFAAWAGVVFFAARPAHAWTFEEHSNLGRGALVLMGADDRAVLEKYWRALRASNETATARLCPDAFLSVTHNRTTSCIDFGALAAIAADHSCSPDGMWATITGRSPWLLDVAGKAAELDRDLVRATTEDRKVDLVHANHLDLQGIDDAYLSRARDNAAHFMLARDHCPYLRQDGASALDSYLVCATRPGSPISSTAVYVAYHAAAMSLAAKLAHTPASSPEYAPLVRRMLTAESFALHFLGDGFSAGHIVGTWGSSAERLGTHDYYNQFGVDAQTWAGEEYPAYGDAFMRQADLDHAARALFLSLRQLVDLAERGKELPEAMAFAEHLMQLDSCRDNALGAASAASVGAAAKTPAIHEIMDQTVQPSRKSPSLPRFSSEIGFFLRGNFGVRAGAAFGGYETPQLGAARAQGALEVGLGLGIGLEGLTTSTTDGLLWVQGVITSHSGEQDPEACGPCPKLPQGGQYTRVPKRFGYGVRARMPFYLVPGDLIFPGLLIAIASPLTYERMALAAARGTVLRWQKVFPFPWGSFQLVLGRELGVTSLELATFSRLSSTGATLSTQRIDSYELELPIAEIRTSHAYSGNLGGTAILQQGLAVDFNGIGNSYLVYLKLSFEGRAYLTRF